MDSGHTLITMNMIGDLIDVFRGELLKRVVGAGVAGLLLGYVIRPRVGNYFRSEQLSCVPPKL